MLFSSGLAWSQTTTLPNIPLRPAAYILPPVDQQPEVPPIVDPILDDSPVAGPGFFSNVELFFVRPHLNSHLTGNVTVSPTQVDTVDVQINGSMGTTVSPRFEVGYRLPQQLGEFLIADRFETIQRTLIPADAALEKDRLAMNLIDFDWGNRHPFGLQLPGWDIRFNVGVRLGTIYYDAKQDFAVSPLGPDVTEQKATNYFIGVGPESGLELSREIFVPGLAIIGRVSGADMFGELHQTFSQTIAGSTFSSSFRNQVAIPNLTVQAGLSYTLPGWNYSRILLGYVWEEFWQLGRLGFSGNGDLLNRGLFLRAEFNF
jgi:hypothetical protein